MNEWNEAIEAAARRIEERIVPKEAAEANEELWRRNATFEDCALAIRSLKRDS